jgi:hypothetical protein
MTRRPLVNHRKTSSTFMPTDNHGKFGKHGKMRLVLNAPLLFALIRVIRGPFNSSAH